VDVSQLIEAQAPSNIALIKYMGKAAAHSNLPANASLSYTLAKLKTFVQLEPADSDRWEPLPGHKEISLSEKGRSKFLAHLARLKEAWKIEGHFVVRSANNFPSDCGLASSASSFAALTQAVYEWARVHKNEKLDAGVLSSWSRLGSGSSCRSFFEPWALWRGECAEPVSGLPGDLLHAVVIVEDSAKAVSSSEAHLRVNTSSLWPGRIERAEARLCDLLSALRSGDWASAFQICWQEFEDMHRLFETSQPAFSYRGPAALELCERLRHRWLEEGDGPLITMDAGPNVHLLFRADQAAQMDSWFRGLKVLR
jgi:diphosphomevalonate decarboxylase